MGKEKPLDEWTPSGMGRDNIPDKKQSQRPDYVWRKELCI